MSLKRTITEANSQPMPTVVRSSISHQKLDSDESRSIFTEPLRGIVNAARPSHIPPDSDLPWHVTFSLTNLQFDEPGLYTVVLRIDGRPVAESSFSVVALP